MALVIEDGTIVPGATSYVAVADADAVLTPMGNTAWIALDTAGKEAKLVQGFFLSDDPATYQFTGERTSALQEPQWPRVGATRYRGPAVPLLSIPPEVKRAQIMAAGGLADGSIVWGSSASERAIKSESAEGVGSFSYFEPGKSTLRPETRPGMAIGWPAITSILAPLLDRASYGLGRPLGPSFAIPSYGGLFEVGMHDSGYEDPLLSPEP